jgi:hypothetical protein
MAGRGVETGQIDPTSFAASGLAVAITAMESPYLAAIIIPLIAASISGQFIQSGQLIMPDPTTGLAYSDIVQRFTYQKIYGIAEGDKIWNLQFSNRQIEVDLRSKYPG